MSAAERDAAPGSVSAGPVHLEGVYIPTTGEVARAWLMRQYTLDVEAGREPNPRLYGAEFRAWLTAHEEKIRTGGAMTKEVSGAGPSGDGGAVNRSVRGQRPNASRLALNSPNL